MPDLTSSPPAASREGARPVVGVRSTTLATALTEAELLETLKGDGPFTVEVADGKVSLTDAAGNTVNVVQTDVIASNGGIHVIDGVLMPS